MKFYEVHHTQNASSPQMNKTFSTLYQALTTREQIEALASIERELSFSLSYISELEWEAEEASALIKQLSGCSDWAFSTDYLEKWAKDCCERLDAHRLKNLSSLVKGDSLNAASDLR